VARSYFIHTFGCQMNESDSQRMGEALARAGWRPTAAAEGADLVLVNTCAIREKAEDKLYSALGRYRLLKAQRGTKIGVAGCVAQQEKEKLLSRAPYVDFVLGPDHLDSVPRLVETGGLDTDFLDTETYLFPQADPETSRGRATAFVTAMKGCDNVCSFCVVPYTRGREVSRPYAEIVREVARLVEVGVREVTLIGQNVNSYAGGCSFAALIRRVAEVPGLLRIRFTTSHPMDLSAELVRCFSEFLRRTPYDNLFSFIYSPRPHTGAVLKLREWGEVPRPIAIRRLEEVQRLQMERTLERHRARIGTSVEVLVEEPGFGRSRENWTVHFTGDGRPGDLLTVQVQSAGLVALRGTQLKLLDRAPAREPQARRRLTVVSA
jgi:tRNA A37 methylthiotransferase MiaB